MDAMGLFESGSERGLFDSVRITFGDKYSIVSKNAGGVAKTQKPKGGNQGTYLYFKGIFPSMSLNSVTKQN